MRTTLTGIHRIACFALVGFLLPLVAVAQSTQDLIADGVTALQGSDWSTAISKFNTAVKMDSADARSWYRLGSAYHQSGRFEKAIVAFERADELQFAVPSARYNIACAHARLGHSEAALEWLEKAVDAGFRQLQTLGTDSDLDSIRGLDRFEALVEAVTKKAKPCLYDDRYRTMDFWIGDWDVYVNGALVGHNVIARVSDGCALLEDWTSAGGNNGMSLNFFDPAVSKWKQTWVGGSIGEYVEESHSDGDILFSFTSTDAEGIESINRLRFTLNSDGSVRQLFTSSTDGGETWQSTFDGKYVKRDG